VLRKALNDIKTGSGRVRVDTVRLSTNPRYYNNNPGNVGVFSKTLPQHLTRFYSRLEAISTSLETYSTAAEHVATQDTLPATTSTAWIIYTIEDALKNLSYLLQHGRKIITELEKIRNSVVE
jgi:hypothetical protein